MNRREAIAAFAAITTTGAVAAQESLGEQDEAEVPRTGPHNLITDVEGLKVGQSQDAAMRTGVTVILPDESAVAAPESESPVCASMITTHRLEPETSKEQSSGITSRISSGNWILTITFASFGTSNSVSVSPNGAEATATFRVP